MLRATTSRLASSATRPFAETTAGGAGSHDLKCPVSGNNGPRLGRLPSRGLTHSDMANAVGGRHFPKQRRFKQESDCGDWIPESVSAVLAAALKSDQRGSRAAQMLTMLQQCLNQHKNYGQRAVDPLPL